MKYSSLFAITLCTVSLAACNLNPTEENPDGSSASSATQSSVRETKNVLYRGTLRGPGVSIFMQGTHRLELEDGRFVMLESSALDLDEYMDMQVEVFGAIRPTTEEGGMIMRVERVTSLEPESSSSADASSSLPSDSSSSEELAASSVPPAAAASSKAAVASSKAASSKQSSSLVASSVAMQASSVAEPSDELSAKAAIMAKDNVAEGNWTQQYCSTHIGFCVPIHKNWWFNSFGTTTSYLWHVEIGPEEITDLGDGPLAINLMSGSIESIGASDKSVTQEGETTVGFVSWTNNRHIEIRGPHALKAAIEYLTNHVTATPAQ